MHMREISFRKSCINCDYVYYDIDVRQICGILDVNSFEISTAKGESSSIQAIYRSSSLAEHRCVPNLHRTFEVSNLEICLRTMQPITAGTHLTITYTDSLWYVCISVVGKAKDDKSPRERQLDSYKVCHSATSCSRSCYYTSYGSYINPLSYEVW